jgi:ABC-2 type transport system permease protein
MLRTAKICYRAFKAALQTKLEYRVDMALGIAAALGFQAATLGMLGVLMHGRPGLAGWSGDELLLLFGLTALTQGLSELFFNHLWWVPLYVVRGQLDRLLVLPVASLPYFVVTAPELHAFGNLSAGTFMVGLAVHRLHLAGPVLALLPLWALCGSLVYSGLLTVCAAISFRVMGSQSYHYMITVSLLRGSAYPHSVFPTAMRALLAWVLPFAAVSFIPAQVLTSRQPLWQGVLLPPLLAGAVLFIGWQAWEAGLRRYESSGS